MKIMNLSPPAKQQPVKAKLALSVFAAALLASTPLSAAFAQTSPQPASAPQEAGGTQAASQPSPGDAEMMAAMEGLKPATNDMKMTGSVDQNFMLMMIPHHDAGISMSSAEEGFGSHKKLMHMAVVDVYSQKKDNRQMRKYLKKPIAADNPTGSASTADTDMMNAMHKMNQSMKDMKLTGNQDHDFITMMIPHHEAAIQMSQVELKYGKDPRVKEVAEGVLKGQSKDVKHMKKWYKKWFNASYTG
jgi:uncharacterized protein (DUF305 family)